MRGKWKNEEKQTIGSIFLIHFGLVEESLFLLMDGLTLAAMRLHSTQDLLQPSTLLLSHLLSFAVRTGMRCLR